jgi:hypothetical protein
MDQQRAFALREQRARIYRLATDNPSLTVDLLTPELAKLGHSLRGLSRSCAGVRAPAQPRQPDVPRMENRGWKYYEQQKLGRVCRTTSAKVANENLEDHPAAGAVSAVVRKNPPDVARSDGLMENSFRLWPTRSSPSPSYELGALPTIGASA